MLSEVLGIDVEDLEWQDLALCQGLPINDFYDDYEESEEVAKNVDSLCMGCPVRNQCLFSGVENKEHGVWGGIFLTLGKPDKSRNQHKTPDVWKELRDNLAN